jgi:hypothetical protein
MKGRIDNDAAFFMTYVQGEDRGRAALLPGAGISGLSLSQIPSGWRETQNRMILCECRCRLVFWIIVDLFRPRAAMEAEILVLRQQIIVLRRGRPGRMPFLVAAAGSPQPLISIKARHACVFDT